MARDYGYEAQQAAEAHLEACEEALDHEEGDDPSAWPESPAVGPYCGCTTCIVRETLHAAWPILQEAARAELVPPAGFEPASGAEKARVLDH